MSSNRISNIPSSIIENILCLLPIKEAVRTSILSRNWRYNWNKIPKLEFSEHTFKESTDENEASVFEETFDIPNQRNKMTRRCKMFYAIYQVLLSHHGPIHEFVLYVNADVTCVEIDQIISHFARQNTLKKFTLDLNTSPYKLPLSIFSLRQLTDLSLVNCDIYLPPTKYQFHSLESLSLINVKTSTKTLLHLISSSPLLKSFSLVSCYHNISMFIGFYLNICNFKQLINFYNTLFDDTTTLIELFECLLPVEHLTISSGAIQWFVKDGVPQELPTSLVNLKDFSYEDMWFIDSYDLPFLFTLMRSSPKLEKLKLHKFPEEEELGYWQSKANSVSLKDYSDIWLEHLMDLEIHNYSNLKIELEFVKLMLAKSPVLKKLKIYLWDNVTKDEEMAILRILLRSPRASLLVEIIVESIC